MQIDLLLKYILLWNPCCPEGYVVLQQGKNNTFTGVSPYACARNCFVCLCHRAISKCTYCYASISVAVTPFCNYKCVSKCDWESLIRENSLSGRAVPRKSIVDLVEWVDTGERKKCQQEKEAEKSCDGLSPSPFLSEELGMKRCVRVMKAPPPLGVPKVQKPGDSSRATRN